MILDPTGLKQIRDLRQQPVLDALLRQLLAAVAHGHRRAGVVTTQCRFDRGVLPADDQEPLAEVGVRVLKIVADVRQIFARGY